MSRALVLILILFTLPLPAFAYFDPGAGAVLLQLLIAGGIGVIYRVRHWLAAVARSIRDRFSR